ncbi:MAG: penicillin-binding transpeptidase domain-containing protein [Acetivibrionales bacterium]
MAKPNILIKKRLLFMLIVFFSLVLALIIRIAYIQIVQGEQLQKEAFEQQNRGRTLSPKRGAITDRNGKELAISASVETVTVNPTDIKNSSKSLESIADGLSQILGIDKELILSKISKKSMYEVIAKKIEKDVGDKIRRWVEENNISGVYVDEDSKRYYPNRNLASHILGFTGDDNQGLDGIEKLMERYLKGMPGKILSEVDAGGRELPFKPEKRIEATDGLNVVLTIDETIQYFAEKALEKAIDDWEVTRGAAAIVMDPRNGDILALVSKPDFDPNNPFAFPQISKSSAEQLGISPEEWKGTTQEEVNVLFRTVWRNKAVRDMYEPGSTFKAITAAAGLEEDVIHPDDIVNDSPVSIAGFQLKCWRYYNPHGQETFREGVYNSCNPVFVRVAQDLGIDRFYNYVRAFGFYDRTGIDLPGEPKSGDFHKEPKEIDMAVASFGQRFTITPIQLITAYTAIANGGNMMKPRLVKELTDSKGNIVKKFEPEVIRKVISKQTSDTLRDILEGVVSEGTGRNAYVKGYRVAGKTGTSETTESDRYIASFSAIAPADNPVICVLVILDDPDGESHMGGVVAAPVAGKLVEDTLNYLGVERRYTEKDKQMMVEEVYVPEIRNMTVAEATKKLNEYGLKYRIEGDTENKNVSVVEQTPKPNARIPKNSVVILYTYTPEEEVQVAMPDVLNKTISEATEALNKVGLNIKISGMGTAIKQSYDPGTMVPKGNVIEVEFRHLDNIE